MIVKFYPGCGKLKFDNVNYGIVVGKPKEEPMANTTFDCSPEIKTRIKDFEDVEQVKLTEFEKTEMFKASKKQIGGDHYKGFKSSPYKFLLDNQIPHHKAAIIRRILRYDQGTGGGLEDLNKIKHEIDLIIEFEGWEGDI